MYMCFRKHPLRADGISSETRSLQVLSLFPDNTDNSTQIPYLNRLIGELGGGRRHNFTIFYVRF